MLRYLRLSFDNAGTYQHCEIPLDGQGIVHVLGQNLRTKLSNGAGKSTPFAVLRDLQYQPKSNKHLINRHSPTRGFLGELEFEADAHYRVTEAYKHPKYGSGLAIAKDGKPVEAKHVQRARIQLQTIIGLTEPEYHNIVYLTDKHASLLLNGKPAQRDEYLSALFNLDIFDKLTELAKADLADVAVSLEKWPQIRFEREELGKRLEALGETASPDGLLVTLREAEVAFTAAKAEHSRAVQAQADTAQRQRIGRELAELGEIEQPEPGLVDSLSRELSHAERATALATSRAQLEVKLAALPDVGAQEALERRLTEAESKLKVASAAAAKLGDRAELEGLITKLKARDLGRAASLPKFQRKLMECQVQLDLLRKRQTILATAEAECPTCKQSLRDKSAMLTEIKTDSATLTADVDKYRTLIPKLEQLQGLADRLQQLEARLQELPEGDPNAWRERHSKLDALVNKLRRAVRDAAVRAALEQQLSEMPKAKAHDVAEIRERLATARTAIERWRAYNGLSAVLATLTEMSDTVSVAELVALMHAAADTVSTLKVKIRQVEEVETERASLTRRLETLGQRAEALQAKRLEERALLGLQSAYGRSGLRLEALRGLLGAIMEALPKYLTLLFPEEKVQILMADSTFDFRVMVAGVEIPRVLMSRGERALLALALFLATRKVLPPRKRSNILIIDEVLDGVDPAGFPRIFGAFRYLQAEEDISSIFVISHSKPLQTGRISKLFDATWVAVKDAAGVSTMELNRT